MKFSDQNSPDALVWSGSIHPRSGYLTCLRTCPDSTWNHWYTPGLVSQSAVILCTFLGSYGSSQFITNQFQLKSQFGITWFKCASPLLRFLHSSFDSPGVDPLSFPLAQIDASVVSSTWKWLLNSTVTGRKATLHQDLPLAFFKTFWV